MSSVTSLHAPRGLEGVAATTSGICYIDGEQGVLAYRGYDIHDLADHSTFEEVCYLLWFGHLPNASELKALKQRLGEEALTPLKRRKTAASGNWNGRWDGSRWRSKS